MIGKKTLISITNATFLTVSYRQFINTGLKKENHEASSRNLKSLLIFVCVFVLSYFAQVLVLNNGMSNKEMNGRLSYAKTQTEVKNMLDSVEIGYAPF
jgi:hypothetical protein